MGNKNHPFGQPPGTVRGLIAIMLVATFCFVVASMAWKGIVKIEGKDVVYLVVIIIQAYFADKKIKEALHAKNEKPDPET